MIQTMIWTLAMCSPLMAQAFKATPAIITVAEGGRENVLLIQIDDQRFSVVIPKGYGTAVRTDSRSIVFTAESGGSVITAQFTTNYPGALPKEEKLRDEVAAKNPEASLVQSSVSYTDFGPAYSFDLFRPASGGLMLHNRDAYVAYPEGSAEFTFSCDESGFDKQKLAFSRVLNSFRAVPKDDKKNL